ncbi:Putative cuticle protein [Caligus rogercresseyi]|uniref:Cuticle protein n=1 Tax=Caligus rogercresseyi TaxID=217165 RepID=A0A7T8K8B3_CALRO|nr:Putative cuticle protein [Caligus rogercresseyi]
MNALCTVLLSVIGASLLVLAQRPPTDQAYLLPNDAESILFNPISTSFSCEGQQYGYYADVDNNCQIFHVCLPIEDDFGSIIETAHFSFICGNQTIFDQQTLTCNHFDDAFPCNEAPSLYNTVEFGKIPDSF